MGIQIRSRVVPGAGVCQEIALGEGRTIAVVTRRDGRHDVVVDDGHGGGAVGVTLDDEQAGKVAEILGGPGLVQRLSALTSGADALLCEQLPVPHHSPFAGRPLGDTRARTRTGASIVAVVRGGATQPAPGPDFVLEGGDLVVALGTREGLDQLGRILDGTG